MAPFNSPQQSWFKNTLVGKKKDDADKLNRGYYRQHFHDMRLNDNFINNGNKEEIIGAGKTNSEYNWYFHKFKKKTGSNPPVKGDISKAEKWLCAKPDVNEEYFESNLSAGSAATMAKCGKGIELRNTQSYIKDLLKTYATQLDIEDFVAIIETLED